MKDIYINNFLKNTEFTSFFMVKGFSFKVDSRGKQYLDMVIGDKTGEIAAKKWDVSDEEASKLAKLKEKDLVKVRGLVTEYLDKLQVRIVQIRMANDQDYLEMSDFVKAAPEDPEEMFNFIHGKAEAIIDEDLKKIALKFLDDNRERLLYYPAASRNHHAELGGLLYHMKRMLMTGERVCEVYTNLNRDLVVCGVILHDMEKLNEIEADVDGIASGYSFEGQLLGHIIMGIKTVDEMALEIGMSCEKRIMLEHMILSHHYEPEFGSPKKPLFPEAEVLHYLDILDARMYDMQEALAGVEEEGFSEKIFTLDSRKLYKSKDL